MSRRIDALTEERDRYKNALRLIGIAAEMQTGALQKPGILRLVREALENHPTDSSEVQRDPKDGG